MRIAWVTGARTRKRWSSGEVKGGRKETQWKRDYAVS